MKYATDGRETWLVGSTAEWRSRYIERLMDVTKCDLPFAEATYDANGDDHDYSESPEDAADVEISYWTD